MPVTIPRELFEFLVTVDAGKKTRSDEYIVTAAGPLVVLLKGCLEYLANVTFHVHRPPEWRACMTCKDSRSPNWALNLVCLFCLVFIAHAVCALAGILVR